MAYAITTAASCSTLDSSCSPSTQKSVVTPVRSREKAGRAPSALEGYADT